MATSKIEWTDATWNPVTGCTPISEGCAHCYAARMAKRLAGRCGYPAAPHEFDVTLHPDRLDEPLRWRKPRRVFVVSMGDLFHEDVPLEYIYKVFGVMALAPHHTFQVLTKRPRRMFDVLSHHARAEVEGVYRVNLARGGQDPAALPAWPLPNVWLGVTAENQHRADERIPLLLQTPAAVRFVSVEPMLGLVDFAKVPSFNKCGSIGQELVRNFWVICGGETGPSARPMHPAWARSLRDQCVGAGVPFFFKKWGGPYNAGWVDEQAHQIYQGSELDGREWHEYPEVTK